MKVTPTPGSIAGRRIDRVGDPLDGLVNLFDLSLVLAVGLLLAALSSAGVVGLVSPNGGGGGGAPIAGQPQGSGTTQGKGQEVGKVYRLSDGTYVFAPSGTLNNGQQGATGATAGGAATPNSGAVTPQTAIPNQGITPSTPVPGTNAP